MSMQQVPRHRAASGAQNRGRPKLGTANENRALIAAAGTVFVALLVLALVTLPGHAGSTAAPNHHLPGLDEALTYPDAALPSTGTIAPPSSVTHAPGKHPSANSNPNPTKVPALTKQPLASRSGTPSGQTPSDRTAQRSASSSTNPQPGTTAPPPLPDAAQVAQAVFDSINTSRRDAGLRPLKWSPRLHDSAHQHNLAMARANTLSHQLPGEDSLGDRESAAGVTWWWAAENIAESSSLTTQSALGLETGMVNERAPNDGHRRNILAGNADVVGVDILFDTTHHRLWLTEDFAQTTLL
jgi:uncharacterized protein YkwD